MNPEITSVEIKPYEVEGLDGPIPGLTVDPIWSGVDRPNTGGYFVKNQKLADRLKRAMLAGVVYPEPKISTDVKGQTFVTGRSTVLGRTVNADLKRLGF